MRLTPALVGQAFRTVPEPETGPYRKLGDDEIAAIAARLIAAGDRDAPVWVFAYGSLIWKPAFAPAEVRRALARGWHRSFCIDMNSWRGTPDAPGLMLALARGGSCSGLAFRLRAESLVPDLELLVKREMPYHELSRNVRWTRVETARGPVPALVFYADPVDIEVSHRLPQAEVARRLARACGYAGSCAEYLYNTVSHLEAEGIRDRTLWRLQRLVADEIAAWADAPPAAAARG